MQSVRTLLANLSEQIKLSESEKVTELRYQQHCFHGLGDMRAQLVGRGFEHYEGKVRELIRGKNALWIYHTDRLSAFDRFINYVPYKGAILCSVSQYWFKAVEHLVPTHLLANPHERVLVVEPLTPIRAEIVVRGYLAGSMARAYQGGTREFCGIKLEDGLKEFQKLPHIMITPTSKAAVYEHDENTTAQELIAKGVVTTKEWSEICEYATAIFKFGQDTCEKRGWILVDTKYEFGRDANGKIKLIDEIHTPDSARFWKQTTYASRIAAGQKPEMLDKDIVRNYLLEQGFSGHGSVPLVPYSLLIELGNVYLDVCESLMNSKINYSSSPLPLPA